MKRKIIRAATGYIPEMTTDFIHEEILNPLFYDVRKRVDDIHGKFTVEIQDVQIEGNSVWCNVCIYFEANEVCKMPFKFEAGTSYNSEDDFFSVVDEAIKQFCDEVEVCVKNYSEPEPFRIIFGDEIVEGIIRKLHDAIVAKFEKKYSRFDMDIDDIRYRPGRMECDVNIYNKEKRIGEYEFRFLPYSEYDDEQDFIDHVDETISEFVAAMK